ncbi:MAG: rhodanese-like domain-containing protein [Jejuia sp.]
MNIKSENKIKMGLLSFFFKKNEQRVKNLLKQDAIILDVRTKREWNEAHIPNAIHVPLSDLKDNIEALKKLDKPFIVHCKSGVRSAKAAKLLKFYKMEAVNGGGMADLTRLL